MAFRFFLKTSTLILFFFSSNIFSVPLPISHSKQLFCLCFLFLLSLSQFLPLNQCRLSSFSLLPILLSRCCKEMKPLSCFFLQALHSINFSLPSLKALLEASWLS